MIAGSLRCLRLWRYRRHRMDCAVAQRRQTQPHRVRYSWWALSQERDRQGRVRREAQANQ